MLDERMGAGLTARLRARLQAVQYDSLSGRGRRRFRSHHVEALVRALVPFFQVELVGGGRRPPVPEARASEAEIRALRAAMCALQNEASMAERFARPIEAAAALEHLRVLEGYLAAIPGPDPRVVEVARLAAS